MTDDKRQSTDECISALRVDLYNCEGRPSYILSPFLPKKYKNKAWIPQTMGDQIWVLYEFYTIEDRLEWESTLPERIKNWLDRKLIKSALIYGWHIRNVNGFY